MDPLSAPGLSSAWFLSAFKYMDVWKSILEHLTATIKIVDLLHGRSTLSEPHCKAQNPCILNSDMMTTCWEMPFLTDSANVKRSCTPWRAW